MHVPTASVCVRDRLLGKPTRALSLFKALCVLALQRLMLLWLLLLLWGLLWYVLGRFL